MSTTTTPRPGRRAPLDRHRLTRLRIEKGLTQQALAELAGLSTTHISRLEAGHGGVSASALAALATALGCTVAELMPHEPADQTPTDVDVQPMRHAKRAVPDAMPELRR